MKTSTWAFRLAALVVVCAAAYHLIAFVHPAIDKTVFAAGPYPGHPRWRHLVFVGINVSLAWLLLLRPMWLIWPYIILMVQQLNGHGGNAWRLWVQSGRISWADVATLTVELLILLLLLVDWRKWRSRGRQAVIR